MSMKNSKYTIWNRTSDLPICRKRLNHCSTAVPQSLRRAFHKGKGDVDCHLEQRVHIPQEVIKYAAFSRIVKWTRGDFKVEGEAFSSLVKLPLKHFVS